LIVTERKKPLLIVGAPYILRRMEHRVGLGNLGVPLLLVFVLLMGWKDYRKDDINIVGLSDEEAPGCRA
jgi:hypothetical protein